MSILENIKGNCVGNRLGVRFDPLHNKVLATGLNNLPIIRVDKWANEATKDDPNSKLEETTDYKETHPQICYVTIPNENYPYKVGDKLFVHYMSFEVIEFGDIVTYEGIIIADYVFFKILPDGSWDLANDNYIGEPIITGEETTASGIISSLGKKDQLKVKITHVCKPYLNKHEKYVEPCVKVGDIAISIDKYNYEFNYEGKKYIRLTSSEIIGTAQEV